MKKIAVVPVLAVLLVLALVAAERSHVISLPSSKQLSLPVPGHIGRTNSFPATITVSPDQRYAAFLNQGYGTQAAGGRQSIAILDLSNNQLRDFPDDRLGEDAHQSYFIGLAFSTDGTHLYASMGSITDPEGKGPKSTGNGIAVYKFAAGQVTPERFINIAPQTLAAGKQVSLALRKTPRGTAIPYPAGFAVLRGDQGDRLLIANNYSDNVVLLDVQSGQVLKSFDLSRSKFVPSAYPYTVVTNKAGTKAWVSLWNAPEVAELDLPSGKIARRIFLWDKNLGKKTTVPPPSPHPATLVLGPNEDTLYVALANEDCVLPVDLASGYWPFCYRTAPSYGGSAPLGIAFSPNGKRLYVASASQDAVAVFDVKPVTFAGPIGNGRGEDVRPVGFIPTEWYPSALAVVGNDLLIATAKGQSSGPNNMMGKLKSERRHREHPYIPTLIGGSVARLSLADSDKNLAAYTRQVEHDNLQQSNGGEFAFAGGKNPIRHVIYILKENRTYDQILGDLPVGDGDPSLTMYGADVTPNEHKLALQFGVLDNFYDSGEVSGDGHIWSNAATTSDYNEKNWPIAYRSKERTYDADGTNAEELPLEKGLPDIDDPGTGFLWDNLARSGLSYRVYGEFIQAIWCKPEGAKSQKEETASEESATCQKAEIRKGELLSATLGNPPGGPSPWPWSVPQLKRMRPTKAALRDHFDPNYPDFNTAYPDQLRADEFLREFNDFVKARGTANELPRFILLYLPDDHTAGTTPGKPTPRASVADNDLAVGRVVEAVSHSPYWDDTAIFMLEDDAQDGADHIDAHRSTAFVISKYAPRTEKPFIDHNFYTTVSMIHTMEALLGLPPMNLFDAHAPLIAPLLSGPGTQLPYQADDRNLRNGLIYQMNGKNAAGAKESSQMDFSRPDAADAAKLNQILWRDAKGDTPMPASR